MSVIKKKIVENTIEDATKTIELASNLNEKTIYNFKLKKSHLIKIYNLIIKIKSLNRDISTHLSCKNGDTVILSDLQYVLNNLGMSLHKTLQQNLNTQKLDETDLLNDEQKQTINSFITFTNATVEKLPTLKFKEQISQYNLLTKKYRSLPENGVDNAFVRKEYFDAVNDIKNELFKLLNFMLKVTEDIKELGLYKALSLNNQSYQSMSHNLTILNHQLKRLEKAGLLEKGMQEQYSNIVSTFHWPSFQF